MESFLDLFDLHPGSSYLIVCVEIDELVSTLEQTITQADGRCKIILYGNKACDRADVLRIASFDRSFNTPPREYDGVLFYNLFAKHKDSSLLLKHAYRSLANAAQIFILEPSNTLDRASTCELLEHNEFRAPNRIDDVVDGFDLFAAKKMHMWGNGL